MLNAQDFLVEHNSDREPGTFHYSISTCRVSWRRASRPRPGVWRAMKCA